MSVLQMAILAAVLLAAVLLAAGWRVRVLSARLLAEEARRREAEAEAARLAAHEAERPTEDADALRRINAELVAARDDALAASRAKSAFLANMGHELRTPLNAILGYSELIQEECEDAGHVVYVDDLRKISGAGRQLLELINGVLDLSRIEAGRMDLRVETIDVRRLAEEIVATVLPLAQLRRNTISLEVAPDAGSMRSDPAKVRQIVYTLVGNACKLTEGGHIDFVVARDGDHLTFTLRDAGAVLDEAQAAALFSEFWQADGASPRKHDGTGLGLAIARRLATMLDGDVAVRSANGEGSVLTARLAATIELPEKQATHAPGGHADRRGVVLVVDDDPHLRDLATRHLSAEGLQVVTAEDGESALREARRMRPDLITLDVLLPGMDGWRVLRALKADPDLAGVPVVMVTMLDELGAGLAVGADAWLTKPLSRESLVRTVRRCLGEPPGEAR